jgi:uncharacterized protein YcbK (DUF882 family)
VKSISPHFYQHDFSCPCGCGFADVSKELVELLETVQQHFEQSVLIHKGCCCTQYSKECGDIYASQHLLGTAADITVNTIAADRVADYLETRYPKQYGIGRSENYTHIDIRASAARWRE